MLTHSAELVAYLPITRALMATHDPATIQDTSKDIWPLTGSDLLVLVNRNGEVVALHTKSPGFTRERTVAVWVGNMSGQTMQHVSGITGAGPLFNRAMTLAMEGVDAPQPLARRFRHYRW